MKEPTRTLWTKALFEGLYLAVEKKNAEAVRVALDDLKAKGIPANEILRYVREDQGKAGEAALRELMRSGDDDQRGIFFKLKNLLR
ncbi:MAG: hypothetical protein AAF384_03085 [Pseudomonadota bacterium]